MLGKLIRTKKQMKMGYDFEILILRKLGLAICMSGVPKVALPI
jgi:hypothetical protein